MLEVKPILPQHWPLLKSVRLRALADAPYAFGTTWAEAAVYSDAEWQARARRFSELPPAAGCFVFVEGVPCGLASAYLSVKRPQAAGLSAFWVALERRGQGVADALVTFLADWARVQGAAALEADVVEDNHRAVTFYKRMGFTETGQSEPFRGDPNKRILLLAKKL